MFDWIKELDFTSPKPNLLVDRQTRFKNIYGGLLTIFSFMTIFVFSIFLLVKLLNRENMTIIYNEEFIGNPFLNFTNFPVFFEVYNANGNKFENASRLFSIKSKQYMIRDVLVDGEVKKDIKVIPLNITSCSLLINDPKSYYNTKEMLNTDIRDKKCLDLSRELHLSGSIGDQTNQSFIAIDIDKCTNSSLKNDCYPSEYIDSVLGRPHFVLRFGSNYINNNNVVQPEVSYLKSELITFNSQMLKMVAFKFNYILYNTDYGYIFSDNKERQFYKQGESSIDSLGLAPGNNGILKIEFSMSKTKGVYYRHFEKFQTVMASLGAITRLIFFIVSIMNNMFNEYYYYNFICNYINIYEHSNHSNWEYSNKILKNITPRKKMNNINNLFMNKKNIKENSSNIDFLARKNLNKERNCLSFKENYEIFKENAPNNSNVIQNKKDIENSNPNIFNSQVNFNDAKRDKSNFLNINHSANIKNDCINNEILEQQRINGDQIYKNNNSNINKGNFASPNTYFSFATNFKKKYKLDITCRDIFRKLFYFFKNEKIITLDLGISYIEKKISIEEIIRKLLEIDKLKFLILTGEQIKILNSLTGPNLFANLNDNNTINKTPNKKKLNKKNSDLFRFNVDEFWSNYEFEKLIQDLEKIDKSISISDKINKLRK